MESSPRFVGLGTKRREHDELHSSIGDLLQIYFLPNQCLNENKEHGAVFFHATIQIRIQGLGYDTDWSLQNTKSVLDARI